MRPASSYDPQDEIEKRNHKQTLITLLRYIWPKDAGGFKVRIIVSLGCLLATKLLSVYIPFIYKYIIDHFEQDSLTLTLPIGLISAYGLAKVSQSFFGELRDFLFIKVSQRVRRTVSLQVFDHLHRLSLAFHLERQTGGISRVIERGTRAIRFVISFAIFNIGPTLLELSLVVILLGGFFDVSFSIIILVTVSSYILLTVKVTEWRLKYRREMNQKDTKANTQAIDSLLNFETVKYFSNEEFEKSRFDQSLKGFEDAAIKSQGSLLLLNVGQQLIIGLGTVSILYLAAEGVVNKTLSIGDFVLVNTYMMQLFIPLNFLGFVYREIKQSLVDMDKMFEILDIEPAIKDVSGAKDLNLKQGKIAFKNVSFTYQADRPILKDLSFTIDPGQTLAIVGQSGAGKSTISRLLMRFYDVSKGSIMIDGMAINEVSQQSLRRSIGIVPQDTVLFNDSLDYNIGYGDPLKSKTDLQSAIESAQLADFIKEIPEGLATKVGERGLKLSGGEKQRVAIARAILRDPKILILDEATSSLDSKTEQEIQQALKIVSKGRTTLIIAHRLSTIVDAHQILVLDKGQIVEKGSHPELLAKGGLYSKMWQRQQQDRKDQ